MSAGPDDFRITRARLIRQGGTATWRSWVNRSVGRRRVITERQPSTVVEMLEPRYLLSADLLAVPPQPNEQEVSINLKGEAEQALRNEAQAATGSMVNEVIFVDPSVVEHEKLVSSALQDRLDAPAPAQVEVVYLDREVDGIQQITAWLKQHQSLQAIHIVSHGEPGSATLGASVLDGASLSSYQSDLASWSDALAEGADLLFYGCSIAETDAGVALVQELARITGADVAASKTAIGSAELGGNWELEKQIGPIDTPLLFTLDTAWVGLLSGGKTFTTTAANEELVGTAGNDTFIFTDDWGNDTAAGGGGIDHLDFSAVTGDLLFVIDGGSVTVQYLDGARDAHQFVFTGASAGQSLRVTGGQGNDVFRVIDDSALVASTHSLVAIDGGSGNDLVEFVFADPDREAALVLYGDATNVSRIGADASGAFVVEGVETFTGDITLGEAVRSEITAAIDAWSEVVSGLFGDAVLGARVPVLDLTLAQVLGEGLTGSAQASVEDARTTLVGLLNLGNVADINALTSLGALAGSLQTALNAGVASNPFRVTAGIHEWSELRLDLQLNAVEALTLTPSLSSGVVSALSAAGFALTFDSDLSVSASLSGSAQLGIALDGLTTALTSATNGAFANAGFLRVNPLTIGLDAQATDIEASVGLSSQVFGPAATAVVVNNGTVDLSARASLSLDGRLVDGDGRIALTAIGYAADLAVRAEASGAFDARLPLTATLGSFNLSEFGTPTLILSTDNLLSYQNGTLVVTSPAVSLDVAINQGRLVDSLMDLLAEVKSLGQNLPFGLFDAEIPGLGQSLNQLLTNAEAAGDAGGLGGSFDLVDAAGHYFFTNYNPAEPDRSGFTLNPEATVRGLLEALNRALAGLTQIRFDADSLDWSGQNLAGFDFTAFRTAGTNDFGIDFLRGMDFSGADLRGANFSGLNLSGVDFSGARFDATTLFAGALLRDVNFANADLRGAVLSGVDLRRASFSGARIDGANFSAAAVFDVDWANVRFASGALPDLAGMLSNADLSGLFGASKAPTGSDAPSTWQRLGFGLDLSGLAGKDWSRFDLSGLDFSGVNLSGFNLSGANLRGAGFYGATLDDVDLSVAFAWDVRWGSLASSTDVVITDLINNLDLPTWGSSTGTAKGWGVGVDLSGFDLSGWDLSGINFTDITLTGANFAGSVLAGAKLPSFDAAMNFSFADLRGVDLSGVSTLNGLFRGANFSGLDFSGISFDTDSRDFTGADFSGSVNLDGLFSNLSKSVQRVFDNVNFRGVDFSGLDAANKSKFTFGDFKGVNFDGAELTGLNFSGVDLSGSSLNGANITDAILNGATLLGTALQGATGTVASATGAFIDALSALPTSWTSNGAFMDGLNTVVIDDIFDKGAPGPAFAFSGGIKFDGRQVELSMNLVANVDRSFSTSFALDNNDLPPQVAGVLPELSLAGTAYGRGVLGLDFDLGVLLGLKDQSLAGAFTVPVPDASSLDPYLRLNRFDVGDRKSVV